MGSSPSVLEHRSNARACALALEEGVEDDQSKDTPITMTRKNETSDESLRSQQSQSEAEWNEDNIFGDGYENITSEELEKFRTDNFERLVDVASRLKATDINSVSVEDLQNSIADDLRYIYDLYGALCNKVPRKELQSFRNDVAQRLLDLNVLDFMVTVIKAFPADVDLSAATFRQHALNTLVYLTLQTLFNYSDASDALCAFVTTSEIMEFCQTVLEKRKDEHLQKGQHAVMEDYLISVHGMTHNVSMRDGNVERLQEMGFTKSLQPYLKSHNEDIAVAALTTLANIVKEDECDIIAANVLLVARLLFMLERGLDTEERRFSGWSCKECGLAVRNLAKNDANKKLLWNLNALHILVKLADTDDIEEQTESVHAIWALSFDEDIRRDIANDEDLGVVDLLLQLRESSTSDSLKNSVNKCLWTLKDELKSSTIKSYREAVAVIPSVNKSETQEGHIMISYQRANRDILKRIKENLTERDYKVWMDIEQMGGSTLQAMAEAVENATVVFLCYSRRYKESDNCRLEAEYAHEQKKPVIPLKMEENYKPDGWLGLMIGSKYFVEFSGKYNFEDKLNDLYRELKRVYKDGTGELKLCATPKPTQVSRPVVDDSRDEVDSASGERKQESNASVISKIKLVRCWTQDDVQNWLTKHNMSSEQLTEITGEEISFLARTLYEAPEQLHRYLKKDLRIKSLLAKSRFVWALQEILDGQC